MDPPPGLSNHVNLNSKLKVLNSNNNNPIVQKHPKKYSKTILKSSLHVLRQKKKIFYFFKSMQIYGKFSQKSSRMHISLLMLSFCLQSQCLLCLSVSISILRFFVISLFLLHFFFSKEC